MTVNQITELQNQRLLMELVWGSQQNKQTDRSKVNKVCAKMMKTKLKILEVKVEHKVDESPDTSYLGEYSSQAGENAIDRKERGDCERNQHRYFNPAQHHNIDDWDHVSDLDVLKAYAKQIQAGHQELSRESMIEELNAHYREQDYKRMESLSAGNWEFTGIIAKAKIWNPVSQVTQIIRSGGLWGIESDSEADYLKSVEAEELANLKTELLALGIGERAIAKAFSKLD